MLTKLYNESLIKNPGELHVSQLFNEDFICDDLHWYIIHSLRISNHTRKRQGESDFVIISEKGLLVLEVKGGIVHFKDSEFYFPATKTKPKKYFDEDPFEQADGSKYSIINFFKKHDIKNCFVQSAVAFPDSPFPYNGIEFDNFYHLDSERSFYEFICESKEHAKPHFIPDQMSSEELNHLVDLLSPEITPSDEEVRIAESLKKIKSKIAFNTLILHGLSENPRLLIQGPPGSGKTSYALEYAQGKASEGKKGLYLCFNLLLADDIAKRIPNVDVHPIWPFFRKELENADIPFDEFNYDQEESLFLNKCPPSSTYDFVVIDEAQDLFGEIMEKVLQDYLPDYKEYLILYDLEQAYNANREEYFSKLKESSTHFKFLKNFRAIGSEEIAGFVEQAQNGVIKTDNEYQDIEVFEYKEYAEIPKILITQLHQDLEEDTYEKEDLVILNTTDVLRASVNGNQSLLEFYKAQEATFYVPDNSIPENTTQIVTTTPLKYKGLEKPVVYLVVDDIKNKADKTYLQFLIGITRAQSKLVIIKRSVEAKILI